MKVQVRCRSSKETGEKVGSSTLLAGMTDTNQVHQDMVCEACLARGSTEELAEFQVIHVGAAASTIPEALIEQVSRPEEMGWELIVM